MDERAEDDGFIEDGEAEFLEEDEVLLENAVHCPTCNDMTGHLILNEKPKGNGADYLLQCEDCSKVHTAHIRPPPVMKIPFVLTEGPSSMTRIIEIDADEVLELEDVFKEDEKLWSINQIERKDGRLLKYCVASEIARASALRCDMVRVKLTMTRGEDSTCLLYTSPSPRDRQKSRMPSSA